MYQSGFTKHVDMMCSMLRAQGQKKQLIVVAVSSPYDFAMDKSIGTYICSFDFTENALRALLRALVGETSPSGTLPGTLRKSRRVQRSKQHWLVEHYDRERDASGLNDLIRAVHHASAPDLHFLEGASAATFELNNPNITEGHYVVRNSSTGTLYGFAATYFLDGHGIMGALLVDPTKRAISIGKSLHIRAMKGLTDRTDLKKVQLGTVFPGAFLGIPDGGEVNMKKNWFSHGGWDTKFPRRITNMVISDLGTWSAPDGLLQNIQMINISFDLIHGLDNDNSESVLNHVRAHALPEVLELYRFALSESKSCGIVRAKDSSGNLVGTIVICRQNSALATYIPPLASSTEDIGGIIAPVILQGPLNTLALQGLALMGVRQNKGHKASKSVFSWVRFIYARLPSLNPN